MIFLLCDLMILLSAGWTIWISKGLMLLTPADLMILPNAGWMISISEGSMLLTPAGLMPLQRGDLMSWNVLYLMVLHHLYKSGNKGKMSMQKEIRFSCNLTRTETIILSKE